MILSLLVSDGQGGSRTEADTIGVNNSARFDHSLPFEGTLEADLELLAVDESIIANPGFCHFGASVAVLWTNTAVVVFTVLPTLAFLEAATRQPIWFPPDT